MATQTRSLPPVEAPISARIVAGDRTRRERIEETLDGDDLSVETTATLSATPHELRGVDCLVTEYAATTRADGLDLETLGRRASAVPVVVLVETGDEAAAVVDAARDHCWMDCFVSAPDASTIDLGRLEHRIRGLVDRRRLADLTQRSLSSVELAADAIAIVDPDDEIEFLNRSFAVQFGYDRKTLCGESWRTLFTDESVERLESTAIPTVADGWRWTGSCTGRCRSGETADVTVRLAGPETGGLVFVVDTPTDAAD
ncbi:PAS sensor protein [Natronolimnohabitans innermongolicus JCM 12255]|uniref:PAS sensor protein n=2 Tax=Natronolimnohabitans innermongolicus TaxID=253107 RepID=L9X1Y0_9EURY|nr:PAS sensor protein [Natronolimnohabitans innermongolicus JCM 12255]